MICCPTCGKKAHLEIKSCPRCETELMVLFKIEELAKAKYYQGCAFFKKQDFKKAYITFNASYSLKADDTTKNTKLIIEDVSKIVKQIQSVVQTIKKVAEQTTY